MHLCNFCRQIHHCTGGGGVKPISKWPGPPFPARANMCEWKSKSWRQRFSWWSGDTRVRLALEQCSLYFVLCPPGQDNPRWTMESEVSLMNSLKIWVGQGQWYWPTHLGGKREQLMLWCHTRCLLMEQVWHEERGEKCVSSNVVSFLPGELKLWWLCVVVCIYMYVHFLFQWNFFSFHLSAALRYVCSMMAESAWSPLRLFWNPYHSHLLADHCLPWHVLFCIFWNPFLIPSADDTVRQSLLSQVDLSI